MKKTVITLCIILVLIATASTTVVAQETGTEIETETSDTRKSEATPASESNESALLVIDRNTRLVEKSYDRDDGVLTLVFYSDRYTPVDLVAPTDSGSSSGTANFESSYLQPGQRTTVTIGADPNSKVWISTDVSRDNGQMFWIEPTTGGGLISGPWTGVDVRDAAIGASLGTAFASLLVVVRRRYGLHRGMERVA